MIFARELSPVAAFFKKNGILPCGKKKIEKKIGGFAACRTRPNLPGGPGTLPIPMGPHPVQGRETCPIKMALEGVTLIITIFDS